MLAVTFSGGDKMMRSIVSTDHAHASPALQLGQLCPFWWPRSRLRLAGGSSAVQGMVVLFIRSYVNLAQREVPVCRCSPCRHCLSGCDLQPGDPVSAAVIAGTGCSWPRVQIPAVPCVSPQAQAHVRPRGTGTAPRGCGSTAEHGGLGAASGSLNRLAPALSLFWHIRFSQLNFSEYFYQLFLFFCQKMTSCQQNVLFAQAKEPGLFSPGLTQRDPPSVAVGLRRPHGCDPFLSWWTRDGVLRAGTRGCGSMPAGEELDPASSNRLPRVLGKLGERGEPGLGLGKLLVQFRARAGIRTSLEHPGSPHMAGKVKPRTELFSEVTSVVPSGFGKQ